MRDPRADHAPSAPDPTHRDRLERCVQFESECSSNMSTMVVFLVIVSLAAFAGLAGARADEFDSDDLRTIKNQLNLLMEKRQQDYQQLEKSLYESLRGSTDFDALKDEIKLLR